MGWCDDPSVTYLRKFGYNVVRLPRSGVAPLLITHETSGGQLRELGVLTDIWESSTSPPQIKDGETVGKIESQSTAKLEIGVGLDVFGNLLKSLGLDAAKISASYGNAKTLQIHFGNVKRKHLSQLELGEYMANGKLKSQNNPYVDKYFKPGGQLYIVTEVLASNSFSISAFDESEKGLEVSLPEIQSVINADAKVTASQKSESTIEFEGKEYLTFAFLCTHLSYNAQEKQWQIDDFPLPGSHHLSKDADSIELTEDFRNDGPDGAVFFAGGYVDLWEVEEDSE